MEKDDRVKFEKDQFLLIVETLRTVKRVSILAANGGDEESEDRKKGALLTIAAVTSGLMSGMDAAQAVELSKATDLMESLDETAKGLMADLDRMLQEVEQVQKEVNQIEPMDDEGVTSWMRGEL